MSRPWVSTYVQSGLRFARRNGGKIALFTIATGSAIAAATYMRRQFRAMNESLEVERAEGARKLRAVFVANSQTVRSAFRALLPVARDMLATAELVDSSRYIARLREKPKERHEKQELWEKVKLASLTHLISAVYIAAVLYSILSLQMNLLARYTNSSLDAPVQALPSGLLSAVTSKRFLDLARKNLLDRSRTDAIVRRIEQIVKVHAQAVGLTERLGVIDVECLCANILCAVEADGPTSDTEEENIRSEETKDTALSSPHVWLFSGDTDPEMSGSGGRDSNYDWLVQESLDLCEILDFNSVVFSNATTVLSYALSDMKEEMSVSEKRLPFAHLLPRLDAMATRIYPKTRSDDEEDDGSLFPIETDLGVLLSGTEDSAHFAACVFLSGEKENARENGESRSRQGIRPVGNGDSQMQVNNLEEGNQNEAGESLVTNISELGGADTDDLGLMFDIT